MNRIEVERSSVEFSQAGQGVPVVLLHSTGSSGAQWRKLAQTLSGHYRVIVPNLCGYGATPTWRGTGPFALAREVELIAAVLGHVGEPAHLVGHSYGGAVALHAARARPGAVRSLTLIEPAAFHLLLGGSWADLRAYKRISAVARAVWCSLVTGDYEAGARTFVDYWGGSGSWRALAPREQDVLLQRLPKIGLDFYATLRDPARVEDFAVIDAPTFVMQAALTTPVARRVCARLHGIFPGADVHTVEEAGHMSPLTHAAQVNAALQAQLEAWDSDYENCLRQVPGGMPNSRRKARLNAASVS